VCTHTLDALRRTAIAERSSISDAEKSKSRWRGGLDQAALDVRVLHARMGKMPMPREALTGPPALR
jgi:hypothetical protein